MSMVQTTSAWTPRMLSILRIVSGLLFLQHGTGKLLKFPQVPMFQKMELLSLSGIGGMIELIGGVLLAIGLFTRPVAFILSGEMAVAYFYAHASRHWAPIVNGGELAVLYCFVFLFLAFAGGGAWSLDEARRAK